MRSTRAPLEQQQVDEDVVGAEQGLGDRAGFQPPERARASAHDARELGQGRPPGPSAAVRPASAPPISVARPVPPGRARSRSPRRRARPPARRPAAARDPLQLLLGAGDRRGRAGCASRPPPRRPQVGVVGRWVAQQQQDQLALAPAALALEVAARLGVALHRVGRQLLDEREDRLGQQAQHLRVGADSLRRVRHPPPGHARRPGRPTAASRACGPGAARPAPARRRPRPGPRAPDGLRISSTNWRSASVTPVRTPRPNRPSSGRAYSGTSRAIVARISSVMRPARARSRRRRWPAATATVRSLSLK